MSSWTTDARPLPVAGPAPVGYAPGRVVSSAVLVLTLVVGLLLGGSGFAQASEEETEQASLLVLQSIALIANRAPAEAVTERLEDALAAPDPAGTDLAAVERALTLVQQGSDGAQGAADLDQARQILVGAIDIRFATGYGSIPEPGVVGEGRSPYATGAETGTTAVLDGLVPARGISDGGDVVLLILSVLAVATGLVLARRWRPHTSISELRRRSAAPEES